MHRRVAGLLGLAGIALLLGTGMAWNEYLRPPPLAREPLPPTLVALDSPAGQALLAGSEATADYDDLQASFVPQSRKSYCGVASAVVALNAAHVAGAPFDQRTVFDAPSVALHALKVSLIGMSLREFGELLRANGAHATVVRASGTDVDAFRREVRANLAREGDYLLVNYARERLGQAPSGHISPVAAYHARSDRLLVLDVAANRYPPTWVHLPDMWDAMRAPLNAKTPVSRGFVIVHAAPGAAGGTP